MYLIYNNKHIYLFACMYFVALKNSRRTYSIRTRTYYSIWQRGTCISEIMQFDGSFLIVSLLLKRDTSVDLVFTMNASIC